MNKSFIVVGLVLSTLPSDDNIYGNDPIYRDAVSSLSSYYDEVFDGAVSNCAHCNLNEQLDFDILSDENYIKDDIAKQNVLSRLNALHLLDENWDGYEAPRISEIAINLCKNIIGRLPLGVFQYTKVLPSEYGGVELEREIDGNLVHCCFGDETFSYYVERQDKKTEFYSFLDYDQKNITTLITFMSEI